MNEAMPPVQPLTPQPSTPATPPAPKPPMVPPQAPPKPPSPPAAPPTKPASAPPEPSVRPEPTPHDPALQPHPEKKRHWLTLALIALVALILGGFAFLLVWPRLANAPQTPTASTTSNAPAQPGDTGTIIPPEGNTTTSATAPTTTQTTPSTPVITDQPMVVLRGGTDVWFEGDEKTVRDPKTGHQWKIRAISFGDSRCPVNVVCVWAGERTVTLDVTDLTSGRTERVTLGTSRATGATVLGLKLTLIEIDDGKGGVYAEIKAE